MTKLNRVVNATRARAPDPSPQALPAHVMRRFVSQPGFLLARVNQIYVALHNEASEGRTPAQSELLLLIATRESLNQATLARAAGLDTSTTALVLDNLESQGLVARVSDPDDRRRSLLQLTPAGRRQVPGLRDIFQKTNAQLVEPLKADVRADLVRMLRHIGANPVSPAPLWVPEDRHEGIGKNAVTSSFGFLGRRALQVSEAYFLSCAESLSLTPRQFSALFIANRVDQLNQVAFSRIFGLDAATCSVILKNLAKRGLLHREVSATDRRERLYSLTAAGAKVLGEAQPLVDKSERLTLHALPKTEVRKLLAGLLEVIRSHRLRLAVPGVGFEA